MKAHPEVRSLVGRNPWSALLIALLVAAQFGAAIALGDSQWWLVLGVAWAFGAVSAHALGVLIHELAHDLVLTWANGNRALALFANLPLVFPASIDFRNKHLNHHSHLGEPDGPDTQAPLAWEFSFATSRLKTFIWHGVAPVAPRDSGPTHTHGAWLAANIVLQVVVMTAFGFWAGPKALLFLTAAGWFAFSAHPVGARRYGEHLTAAEGRQPTTSYYGPYNRVAFDVGFHVEHHDLPSVPWNHLRALHSAAPELYGPLETVKSWTGLMWQLFTKTGEGPSRYYLERPVSEDTADHASGRMV